MGKEKAKKVAAYSFVIVVMLLTLSAVGMGVLAWLRLWFPWLRIWMFMPFWSVTPVLFFAGLGLPRSKAKSVCRRTGEVAIALLMYPLMLSAVAEAVWAVCGIIGARFPLKEAGFTVLILTAALLVYGVPHALTPHVTHYRLKCRKSAGAPRRIVLISDIHLGFFTNPALLKRVAAKCSSLDADEVLIAGDIFDEEFSGLKNPGRAADIIAGIKSRNGTYACEGNHDLYCPGDEKEEFFRRARITVLRDESVEINGMLLTCRRDLWSNARKSARELLSGTDGEKLSVVLDHNPAEYRESLNAGADIVLCGHTHGGQTFPGNIMLKLKGTHGYGLVTDDGRHCVVTSGTGIWGLPVRIGVRTEVVCIDIE